MNNPKYSNHQINILSWFALGFFWIRRIEKKIALNAAMRKMYFMIIQSDSII
jgi:hypothetical protein